MATPGRVRRSRRGDLLFSTVDAVETITTFDFWFLHRPTCNKSVCTLSNSYLFISMCDNCFLNINKRLACRVCHGETTLGMEGVNSTQQWYRETRGDADSRPRLDSPGRVARQRPSRQSASLKQAQDEGRLGGFPRWEFKDTFKCRIFLNF